MAAKIEKTTIIGDVLDIAPETAPLFMAIGMHCLGCPSSRGETVEAWDRSRALFQTLADDELVDPTITPQTLLFRLFHEDGVRLEDARPLRAECRCSADRIVSTLKAFAAEDRADMTEADGKIRVTCEYCSKVYELDPAEVEPAA